MFLWSRLKSILKLGNVIECFEENANTQMFCETQGGDEEKDDEEKHLI